MSSVMSKRPSPGVVLLSTRDGERARECGETIANGPQISLSLAAAAGVHSALCSLARRASSISLSLAADTAPARSIRSSRLRVVSQVHGVKPGLGNTNRSTPSKDSPSWTPTATSIPRPEMSVSAGATTCIAWNPDGSSPDSSTTGRRSSNSAHQTSPRRMCPPGTSAVEPDREPSSSARRVGIVVDDLGDRARHDGTLVPAFEPREIALGQDTLPSRVGHCDSAHAQHGQYGLGLCLGAALGPGIFPGVLHGGQELLLVGRSGRLLPEHPLEL